MSERPSLLHEAWLTLQAARALRLAQRLREERILSKVLTTLTAMPLLPRAVPPAAAHRAVDRAARHLARLGAPDTCLIRCAALAALMADHQDVVLHLGVRPDEAAERNLSGHSWVSVQGRIVPDPSAARVRGEACTEVAAIPVRRRAITADRSARQPPENAPRPW